jgi:hypothetical protein
MASVNIADGVLHVELRFWDKILAVHGALHIPLAHVRAARADTAPPVPWFSKLIGTNAPGLKAAGTFFTSDGLAFYDYGAGAECLVLELEHETYKLAVIEIDRPDSAAAAAQRITIALPN